jgi:hypothetical protein
MRRVLVLMVLLFAREAHVSGGYAECFADLSALVCIESDSRKKFRDEEQARHWVSGHREQAERRLATLVPRLRVALSTASADGLPLMLVDDWRLPPDADTAPTTTQTSTPGSLRLQLTLGTVDRQSIAVTVTTTRALTTAERSALQRHLDRALDVPAHDPGREHEGISAPSLALSSPSEPSPPVSPTRSPSPSAPPLAVEDVRLWQPLWFAEPAVVGGVRLGIGTTLRVSPDATRAWTPWMTLQLAALRSSWTNKRCALPAASNSPVETARRFTQVGGFRPWGPLLLDEDVQARVDTGQIVQMARLSLPRGQVGNAVYGVLDACLKTAAPSLPVPPAR